MKVCRLKIIRANIVKDIDTPKIVYISKSGATNAENNLAEKIEELIISKDDSKPIKLQDMIKSEREKKEEESKDMIIDNTIEVNNLEVITKKNTKEEKLKAVNDNNNNIENKNNYPYIILNKKRNLNNSLRYLFKNRLTKNKNKSNSISKSNNSLPKLRTSYLFNSKKNSENISRAKSSESFINQSYPNNNSNDIKLKSKKKIQLKSKNNKLFNSNKLSESISTNSYWTKVEKNEANFGQNVDYKHLIDELITQECNLVKQKEEIIKLYEQKINALKDMNYELMNKDSDVLNREDELKGELILLRNQYENTFRLFRQKFQKNGGNKSSEEEFNKKQKEIDENNKKLNNELKNGELLLVTKPYNLLKLTKEETLDTTFLLRGLFYSRHILDTDKIIDLIWKPKNKIQTIYFLVEEFLNYFNYKKDDIQDILINYIYSFCKKYNYMNKTLFKAKFKKKVGKIKLFNKYIQISKLLHFHKRQIDNFISLIKKRDKYSIGIITLEQLKYLLFDIKYHYRTSKEEYEEILEFMIYCMRKSRKLILIKGKGEDKETKDENQIKNSFYDLFYESLIDFINEYNSNYVYNIFHIIRIYMEKNEIINAENLLKPVINNKNIIKIENKEYIDETILNKYLRQIEILKKNERLYLNVYEEELVNVNEFINDIYENKKEHIDDNEKCKEQTINFIDDIFQNALIFK